jgi:hypothetical protein
MAITITDPELLATLKTADDAEEIRDANGELIGRFARPYPFAPTVASMRKINALAAIRELTEDGKLSFDQIFEFCRQNGVCTK